MHKQTTNRDYTELLTYNIFDWHYHNIKIYSHGNHTQIRLTTPNPIMTDHDHQIIDIKIFPIYQHGSVLDKINILFNINKSFTANTIEWSINYQNPSLLAGTQPIDLKIFAVAYMDNFDRRRVRSDAIPVYRTNIYNTKIFPYGYIYSLIADGNGIHSNNIGITRRERIDVTNYCINDGEIQNMKEIIKWDYWNYKAFTRPPSYQLITQKVDMFELINSVDNIVIDDMYLCYKQNDGKWKIIPSDNSGQFMSGTVVYHQNATSRQTWIVQEKYLRDLQENEIMEIRAIGYQRSKQQWVACSEIIKIGHAFDKISQYHKGTEIDFNDIGVDKIRFDWNTDSFKNIDNGTCYEFSIKFGNEQQVVLLTENHPNLVFLLSYKTNEDHKWRIIPNKSEFYKIHKKTLMRYNNAGQIWKYHALNIKDSNHKHIVRIFAYDIDKQEIIGCTPKWNLLRGTQGIDVIESIKLHSNRLTEAAELKHSFFQFDSPDSPERAEETWLPEAEYLLNNQTNQNTGTGSQRGRSRLQHNLLSHTTLQKRLPLSIVTLICVASALLILGLIMVIVMIQKKIHERKLAEQIQNANVGRNMRNLFDPRFDPDSLTHRFVSV